MSEGDRRDERFPNSLQGLLIMTAQQAREAQTPSQFEEMSEERKQWLAEALTAFSEDTYVKRMQACLEILVKNDDCDDDGNDDDIDPKEMALEDLAMMVDHIDNANDLQKIGGFPIIVGFLKSDKSELRWRSADVIAILSQNNPYSQGHLTILGVVQLLVQLLNNDPIDQVRVKSVLALSCMTSNFDQAKKVFLEHDGLSSLVRSLQGKIPKLRIKASSMLRSMISESLLSEDSTVNETLVKMGIVEQLAALLHEPHELFHEKIAESLAILSENIPQVAKECQRPELQLEKILKDRIIELEREDKDAFETEIDSYKRILTKCFQGTRNNMDTLR